MGAAAWFYQPLLLLGAAYAGYLAWASVQAVRGVEGEAVRWPLLLRLPAVIAAYHLGYGLGSWRGLWDMVRGQRLSAASARITR